MGYTVYLYGTPDFRASADRFKKDRRRACRPCGGGGGDGWSRQVWSRTDIYDQSVQYTCLAKSCLLYSTFRLDVTVDNLWIRPPKRKGLDFDYWTGLGRIDVDCTDCLPVAGISP
jgi:hypothetical protein